MFSALTIFQKQSNRISSWMFVSCLFVVCTICLTSNLLSTPVPVLSCIGDSLTCTKLTATTCVASDPSEVTYFWEGEGLVSGQTSSCAVWNQPGLKTVSVTVIATGASASCTAEVIRSVALPTVYAGCDLLRCDGGLTKVTTGPETPGVTFTWSGPGIVSGVHDLQAYVNQPGVYTVTAYDENTGCSNSASCEVFPYIIPKLVCTNDTITCTKLTATTTVTVDVALYLGYEWSGDGLVSGQGTPTAVWNQPGSKKVVVTILNSGCKDSCTPQVYKICRPPDGHFFPTQTTCFDFVNGTAWPLPQVCYTPSRRYISNAVPGVFFYFSYVTAPSSNFCVDLVQTKNCSGFKLFRLQQGNQIYIYSNGCTKITQGRETSAGQARVCINNAVPGQKYVIIAKYDVKSIIGSTSGAVPPTCKYYFSCKIGDILVDKSYDSLQVAPNCSVGSTTQPSSIEGMSINSVPSEFALHPSYPNPFNPSTIISYDLSEPSIVRLAVYNMIGQEVSVLVDGLVEPGYHTMEWNAVNASGTMLPSGVYMLRMTAASVSSSLEYHQVGKLVLMK